MRPILAALTAMILLVAVGCAITTRHQIDAHIILDIRHIQQQAEGIVDYIDGRTDTLPSMETSNANNVSWRENLRRTLFPVAHAQQQYRDQSPRVTELANRMRERRPEINAYKAQGYVGEDNRGYLVIRDHDDLRDEDLREEVQEAVSEENNDRRNLYREIVRLNQDANATMGDVERVFAQTYLMRANSGEYFQLPPRGRDFDAFANSAKGRALDEDDLRPGAWVQIP